MEDKLRGIELEQFLFRIKENWYWFLIFICLGLGGGYLYNKTTHPTYQANMTVLIKTEDKNSALKSLYKDLGINDKTTSIQNQVGILSSYNLNLKALQDLKWNYSWFRNSGFTQDDLYRNEPFEVSTSNTSEQLKTIPIYIRPKSESDCELEYNSEAMVRGKPTKIMFKGGLKYGQSFVNEYFNFKLSKLKQVPQVPGEEYLLVFNDITQMALEYQDKLDVKLVDKESELVNIKLAGEEVFRVVDYLNSLGKAYILFGLSEKDRMADNTVNFIDSLTATIDSSLQIAGNEYTNFRTKNRVVDLGKESSLVIEKSKDVESQLAMARIKMDYYNNLKSYLKNPSQIKNLVAPSVVGVTDPNLNNLVQKLSDLSSQREVQSYTLQEKNPKLLALDREIGYTQKELSENINNLLSNTQLELDNLIKQKQQIDAQQLTLPKKEQNYINIKRSFDLNNDLYNFLLQRRAEAGIMKASHEPEAQIIDPARVQTAKMIGHYGLVNLLIGLFSGLLIPFLFLFIKHYYDHNIRTISEVIYGLDLPVSGMIKHNKFKSNLPANEFPNSAVAESFRDLRAKLYFFGIDALNGKIVSINSSISGEGKSFVSSNLAAIFAMDNKNVLLVDLDLRKPDLHKVFGFENEKGVSNYLRNEANFDAILNKTSIKNLSLVTTGPGTDYPSELLNNGKLEIFFQEAKMRFDYIIIKNSPASVLSDSLLIQKIADVNIFLLKFKCSTTRQIQYINDLAKMNDPSNILVVLNNVSRVNGMSSSGTYGYYKEDRVRTSTE